MAEAIKVELTPPQKAAAVIVSLGADKASGLYQFMEPEEIEALTLEVVHCPTAADVFPLPGP